MYSGEATNIKWKFRNSWLQKYKDRIDWKIFVTQNIELKKSQFQLISAYFSTKILYEKHTFFKILFKQIKIHDFQMRFSFLKILNINVNIF